VIGLLWLIPAAPFASALLLLLFGGSLSRRAATAVGVGSIGLSALAATLVAIGFLSGPPAGNAYTQVLWTWIDVAGFRPQIAFYLDALSLVMVLVVTVVGFLIHIYAAEFMREDDGFSRYFGYMNLFVASMITLLLANNLVLLLLGWEGVGLCSFLLVGFWYREPVNCQAARKAFIVTRIGDTAMLVGLYLLFTRLDTLQIQELMQRASEQWPTGSAYATAAALLLLGGEVGKSAQLPLQVWLPDAMAGPTPTSALLHAATMVTAGVYLIARTHVLFSLAPAAQTAVGIVGAGTLLLAGFSALTQHDIKRVLVYSCQPDRLHVSRPWRGCMAGGHVPLRDSRLFQGASFSWRGRDYQCSRRRTQHVPHGGVTQRVTSGLLDVSHCRLLARGPSLDYRRVL